MKKLSAAICCTAFVFLTACGSKQAPVARHAEAPQAEAPLGGGCDGCDIMYLGMPHNLLSRDTSAGWATKAQKLEIDGIVYKSDGLTPAAGVVIYYWHTDPQGAYTAGLRQKDASAEHGQLRGWIKTGADGRYQICTSKPGPQTQSGYPAHIYMIVKEPGIDPYFIDQLVFADDPLLTDSWKKQLPNRGGSGVVNTRKTDNIEMVTRDVVLGRNIPAYPE